MAKDITQEVFETYFACLDQGRLVDALLNFSKAVGALKEMLSHPTRFAKSRLSNL
jgi:hypothetical protein